jgi:hypothetical protein
VELDLDLATMVAVLFLMQILLSTARNSRLTSWKCLSQSEKRGNYIVSGMLASLLALQ